ncbi:MAG: FAD-dependent oxidoreductase [Pseudomonadota bacterium]
MADITVRGAGIFGLSIAWALVQRGAAVQLIDPNGPASGSSGGVVGALAPHVPENWNAKKAFQLESLLMAEAFWAEVSEAGGLDPGYRRSGRLQPVADECALELARARALSAAELWRGQAIWEVVEAEGGPWEPATPTGFLIRDSLSALVHPRQACAALCAALQSRGVTCVPDAPTRGITIWATGVAGLEDLGKDRPRAVGAGIKGQAALIAHDARGAPQLFAEGLHIIPHLDGTTAIGSTSEREFASGHATDAQLASVIAKARTAVPALTDAAVLQRWAGVRPRARSRAPILGHWPDRPGHFVANGGFKIGFGMAPKVADVMADLVLEGRETIPACFRVEDSL